MWAMAAVRRGGDLRFWLGVEGFWVWVAELWKEASLPDGAVNVLNGDKTAVDAADQSRGCMAISTLIWR